MRGCLGNEGDVVEGLVMGWGVSGKMKAGPRGQTWGCQHINCSSSPMKREGPH